MILRTIFFLIIALVCVNCSQKIHSTFANSEHVVMRSSQARDLPPDGTSPCNDPLNFAPDPRYPDHTPGIPVQVNVHFMDVGDGVHNLNKEQARVFAMQMIEKCNAKLRQNAKMLLPPGNDIPVIPAPWYFVLTPDPSKPGHDGIYFNYDPDLFYYIHGKNSNRTSRDVITKYAVRPDSVINIFMMPHHPDSVKSPTYKAVGTGIMLSSGIKMAQVFTPSLSPESCVGLLNHEIGHALGLSHTWGGNDGCDDTPKHDNCWYYTDTPPCDSLVSNNLMDYNAWQVAITPCQIGRVMRNVANLSSRVRKFVRADWCTYDSSKSITIQDSIHWQAPKDLSGDIVIADGGILQISCRVSLPQGARIVVSPNARLILNGCHIHNACGGLWEGIEIQQKGKVHGIVEINGNPKIEHVVHALDLVDDK